MPEPAITKWRQLLQIFHDDSDRPYGDLLTPTQIRIIDVIARRDYPRTQLILPTQYGKSLAVALGVLLRISTHKEKWAIVAPTEDKARIIMDYIIDHIFDDPLFEEQLEFSGSKESLKQHRSKTRISFREGGEVRVFSADAGNSKKVKSALMGFGAPNVILDESALISEELYSTAKRMVGGAIDTSIGEEGFILEIGNPSYRNHFHRTWFGSRYMKIFIDAEMALLEGRYSREYLDEMADEAGYEWMYMCQFPDASEVLPNGYRRLVSDLVVDDAYVDAVPEWDYKLEDGNPIFNKWGFKIINDQALLGIDVAGGGANKTKFVVRWPKHNFAMVARTSDSDDLDVIADIAEELIREWNIEDFRTIIDAGGVGHGLPAILRGRGYLVMGVLFGESKQPNGEPIPRAFLNIRAWMYWEARKWLKKEKGRLLRDDGFDEVKLIHYRQNSTLKIQIEPKLDMIKRNKEEGVTVESPDTADGLVLTFVDTSSIVEEDDVDVD
jgi:hypothetical protein